MDTSKVMGSLSNPAPSATPPACTDVSYGRGCYSSYTFVPYACRTLHRNCRCFFFFSRTLFATTERAMWGWVVHPFDSVMFVGFSFLSRSITVVIELPVIFRDFFHLRIRCLLIGTRVGWARRLFSFPRHFFYNDRVVP